MSRLRPLSNGPGLLVIALFLGVSVPVQAAGGSAPLDEVVAIVNRNPILLSDLDLAARLDRARREGSGGLEKAPVPSDLAASLRRLIDNEVVFEEAQRLQVFAVPPEEVDAAVADLRDGIGPRAFDRFLEAHQIQPRAVRALVERDLRVRHYLDGRFRLAARLRDVDLQSYLHDHPDALAGQGTADATEAIRERLARSRFDTLTAAFIADVRRRADIRILHAPDAIAGPTLTGSATAPTEAVNKGD